MTNYLQQMRNLKRQEREEKERKNNQMTKTQIKQILTQPITQKPSSTIQRPTPLSTSISAQPSIVVAPPPITPSDATRPKPIDTTPLLTEFGVKTKDTGNRFSELLNGKVLSLTSTVGRTTQTIEIRRNDTSNPLSPLVPRSTIAYQRVELSKDAILSKDYLIPRTILSLAGDETYLDDYSSPLGISVINISPNILRNASTTIMSAISKCLSSNFNLALPNHDLGPDGIQAPNSDYTFYSIPILNNGKGLLAANPPIPFGSNVYHITDTGENLQSGFFNFTEMVIEPQTIGICGVNSLIQDKGLKLICPSNNFIGKTPPGYNGFTKHVVQWMGHSNDIKFKLNEAKKARKKFYTATTTGGSIANFVFGSDVTTCLAVIPEMHLPRGSVVHAPLIGYGVWNLGHESDEDLLAGGFGRAYQNLHAYLLLNQITWIIHYTQDNAKMQSKLEAFLSTKSIPSMDYEGIGKLIEDGEDDDSAQLSPSAQTKILELPIGSDMVIGTSNVELVKEWIPLHEDYVRLSRSVAKANVYSADDVDTLKLMLTKIENKASGLQIDLDATVEDQEARLCGSFIVQAQKGGLREAFETITKRHEMLKPTLGTTPEENCCPQSDPPKSTNEYRLISRVLSKEACAENGIILSLSENPLVWGPGFGIVKDILDRVQKDRKAPEDITTVLYTYCPYFKSIPLTLESAYELINNGLAKLEELEPTNWILWRDLKVKIYFSTINQSEPRLYSY